MGLSLDPMLVLYFALGLILLYIAGWFLITPLKFILKLALNSIAGGILLVVLNSAFSFFSVMLPLNPFNCVVVGMLGIPGVILLFILQLIL